MSEPEGFNGVCILTDDEFDRMLEHMKNPGGPSEAILRGAALLKQLYNPAGTADLHGVPKAEE